MFDNMTMDNAVTALTGLFVLISIILIRILGDFFIILPVLIGIVAIQSAFTGLCPISMMLKKYNLVK